MHWSTERQVVGHPDVAVMVWVGLNVQESASAVEYWRGATSTRFPATSVLYFGQLSVIPNMRAIDVPRDESRKSTIFKSLRSKLHGSGVQSDDSNSYGGGVGKVRVHEIFHEHKRSQGKPMDDFSTASEGLGDYHQLK
ncbi:hypothetical protein VM1G_11721 [Cytospora mali]|uniref:Uncharacterized protein n=1 Tax=Cytospora mali TaxID=578113 RepID=A0A194W1P8_CYTMA|nr:hypothetical protein VM1G_11721 [Valsa mali]